MYSMTVRCLAALLLAGTASTSYADDPPAIPLVFVAKPAMATNFSDGSFESPSIGANAIVQSPTPSVWTFSAEGAGFASNGSAFGNPTAPDGNQVLYIQSSAPRHAAQTFVASAGRYRLSFKAAQRLGNSQTIAVVLDSVPLFSVTPAGSSFQDFSQELDLAAGAHILDFRGQAAGDNTAFLDSVQWQSIGYVTQGGFDQPIIPAQGIVQAPTPSAWTFAGLAGIAANNSAFTNPPAISGTQVLYLMSTSSVTQTISVPSARLRLSFHAAQLNGGSQAISVRLDGVEVGRAQPSTSQFSTFVFDALALSAGNHTLSLVGQSPTNHTVFVEDVRLMPVVAMGLNWSVPNTWDQGAVPSANDFVEIPSDAIVLLDGQDLHAKTVDVEGELHCLDQNLGLAAQEVIVSGRFICGSPFSRYVNQFTLSLLGLPQAGSADGMGNKVLAAMAPGVIELHGESRASWRQLDGSVLVGATHIKLSQSANWRAGDELVIAPTGENTGEGESRTIAAIDVSGKEIDLTAPLAFTHHGVKYDYSGNGNNWSVDERAEVGLLTRNIRIVGGNDPSPSDDTFGGHVMTMVGTTIHASGIELFRMGQKAIKARYPFHWHLVGEAPGQYIENSSVHLSFNRCITVHQTDQVRVSDNVCYDFIGHGYFLEDGNERYNVFDHNLAVMARRPVVPSPLPPVGQLPLETDYREAAASNGPAAFWISHPSNTYTNNVAAGSEGAGFWYHLDPESPGPDPNLAAFGTFQGNRVHSSRQGFSSCLFPTGMAGIDAPATITGLSVNHTKQAIWPCGNNGLGVNTTFNNAVVSNSRNGMQAPHPMAFNDSLFVAYTPNEPALANPAEEVPWFAISLYDQGFRLNKVHFINYDRPNMSVFLNASAAHKLPVNRSEQLSFQNSPNRFIDIEDHSTPGKQPTFWSDAVRDVDGTLTGLAGYTLVPDHPLMSDASCLRPQGLGTDGFACPYRYSHFRFEMNGATGVASTVTVLRSDGVQDTSMHEFFPTRFMHNFIVNGSYRYSYRFEQGIRRNDIEFWQLNGNPGDETVHELMDVPPTMAISPFSTWSSASSLTDLLTGAAKRYYYRAESASLFVKMAPEGNPDFAYQFLQVCMTPLVSFLCPGGDRSVAPPTVQFTSASTVAAAGAFTVTANVDSPSGVTATHLFIDDVLASSTGSPRSLPYVVQHPVTLAAGSHVLKLTVHNSGGYSFTAIQRLVVGEPAPRLAITSLIDNGTYAAATIPTLQFQLFRSDLLGVGAHVHWLDNAADKGDATSGSVALGSLDAGRHVLEVNVADANHSLRPVGNGKSIFLVKNGVLADFEDGVDPRSMLVVSGSSAPGVTGFVEGIPRLTRIDNEDDYNYTLLPTATVSTSDVLATYRLSLSPGVNVAPYQQLAITHEGADFLVYAKYTSAGWVNLPLDSWSLLGGTQIRLSKFNLPSLPGDSMIDLELRHRKSDLFCGAPPCSQLFERMWNIELLP